MNSENYVTRCFIIRIHHRIFVYLWLYSPCGPRLLFQFLNLYTVGRTHSTGISPSEGRCLHTEQHKHRINALSHPCLEWDWNPRSQCSSGRRQFIPYAARPLCSAPSIITTIKPKRTEWTGLWQAWWKIYTKVSSETPKRRTIFRDLCGRILLKWIL
jgi:hypothetical protein